MRIKLLMAYFEVNHVPPIIVPTRGEGVAWADLQGENYSTLKAAMMAHGQFKLHSSRRSYRATYGTHGSEFMQSRITFTRNADGQLDESSRLENFTQYHNPANDQFEVCEYFQRASNEVQIGASIFLDIPLSKDIGPTEIHFRETVGRGIEQVVSFSILSETVLNKLMENSRIKEKEGVFLQIAKTSEGEKYYLISRSDSKLHVAYEIDAYDITELGIEHPYYKFEGRSIQIGAGNEFMMKLDPPRDVNLSEAITYNEWFIPVSAFYNNKNLLKNT